MKPTEVEVFITIKKGNENDFAWVAETQIKFASNLEKTFSTHGYCGPVENLSGELVNKMATLGQLLELGKIIDQYATEVKAKKGTSTLDAYYKAAYRIRSKDRVLPDEYYPDIPTYNVDLKFHIMDSFKSYVASFDDTLDCQINRELCRYNQVGLDRGHGVDIAVLKRLLNECDKVLKDPNGDIVQYHKEDIDKAIDQVSIDLYEYIMDNHEPGEADHWEVIS